MHWRREWQPTLVFLPGESQGRRSLVGGRLWGRPVGRARVGQDWSDLAAAADQVSGMQKNESSEESDPTMESLCFWISPAETPGITKQSKLALLYPFWIPYTESMNIKISFTSLSLGWFVLQQQLTGTWTSFCFHICNLENLVYDTCKILFKL